MCSSPKGRGGRPHQSSAVHGMVNDMSSAAYSNMVQRANESYERRQKELAEIRAANKLSEKMHPPGQEDSPRVTQGQGFVSWLKHFFQHDRPQHH